MPAIPKKELMEELEAIRLAIMALEQFTVPPTKESEARRKVEMLIALLEFDTL